MHLRKKILVYCCNEETLGLTRYIVDNAGLKFRAYPAQTEAEVSGLCSTLRFHSSIIIHKDGDTFTHSVIQIMAAHGATIMVLSPGAMVHSFEGEPIHCNLPASTPSIEWLYRLEKICARKHGPKKSVKPIIEKVA